MKKVYGIISHPTDHLLSPALFRAAFKHLKMEAEFKVFDINPDDPEALANFTYETDLNQIAGFAVGAPFEESIMTYMDHYDPLAKIAGSVNTVVNEDSKLIGYNTLSLGALQALQEKTTLPGKKALVMGMGHAGRAIAYSLKEFGVDVFVFDRITEKAEEVAKAFDLMTIDYRDIEKEDFDMLINTTRVGSFPNSEEFLLHEEQIFSHAVVMDLVVHPLKTQLLKVAEKAGAKTVSGDRVLLHTTARQFELWFGLEAPREAMEEQLKLFCYGGKI